MEAAIQRLAWLSFDGADGQEYWAAMNLMGRYAAANHTLIHQHIADHLGAEILFDVENHDNFAWQEVHFGKEVIVHRKGATPAGKDVLGIIGLHSLARMPRPRKGPRRFAQLRITRCRPLDE